MDPMQIFKNIKLENINQKLQYVNFSEIDDQSSQYCTCNKNGIKNFKYRISIPMHLNFKRYVQQSYIYQQIQQTEKQKLARQSFINLLINEANVFTLSIYL